MIAALLSGGVAGLAIAMPIGAIATLILFTSADRGWRIGAAAGLGAATVDGVYAAVAVLLGAALAPVIDSVAGPLRVASAVVLVIIGAVMIISAFRRRAPDARTSAPLMRTPARTYFLVLGITIVNPTTVVYFAALVVGSSTSVDGTAAGILFVVGAFGASAAWQLVLATGGATLGRVLGGERGRRWTGIIGGAVIILLAVRTAISA